jgi:3-methyladenine DNA glycosylase AlkC
MKRIFHPYWLWEDYKFGFYDNLTGDKKKYYIEKCLEMFNDKTKTKEFMYRVVNEWKYSCEHNLTNESLNKIAYIGQSACCIYAGIPSTITMESWSLLSEDVKKRSNEIAKEVIEFWKKENKNIQLCLKLD